MSPRKLVKLWYFYTAATLDKLHMGVIDRQQNDGLRSEAEIVAATLYDKEELVDLGAKELEAWNEEAQSIRRVDRRG